MKIPVIPRAEMLAELMRLKYGIAVAGAHGKTTTTSIVASVLAAAHPTPRLWSAGESTRQAQRPRLGKGEYFVVEADESDRSFLMLAPVVAVVTTIDREHLDQYTSLEDIQDAFIQFVNRVPFSRCGDPLYRRAQRPGHHSQREAPHHYLWNFEPGRSGDQRCEARGSRQRVPAGLQR